jgi:hypothetical protein
MTGAAPDTLDTESLHALLGPQLTAEQARMIYDQAPRRSSSSEPGIVAVDAAGGATEERTAGGRGGGLVVED